MKPITNVLIGADPELFFVRSITNEPISAEGLLGGDKAHPVPMEGLGEGFFIQEDNAAAEFNIPPAQTVEQFTKSIHLSLKYVGAIAKKHKLKMAFVPDLDFSKEQLSTKHCQTLGCDPDYNIWIQEQNPRPQTPELMRTAAGHIHIGWDTPTWESVVLVAKMFDLYVTVPSILVTKPNRRRELYGKAGACRPKPYGVECRSVDNFWLTRKSYQTKLYWNVMQAIEHINNNPVLCSELVNDYGGMIIDAINTHNTKAAEYLVEKFDIPAFAE